MSRRLLHITTRTGATVRALAGHSKWHKTRWRKARQDGAKTERNERFGRELRVAVQSQDEGTIADATARAKKAGVPKDIIERAVQRSRERAALQGVTYEATLPGGACVIIEARTDKKTRTAAAVRAAVKAAGGALGADGCAAWAVRRLGLLQYHPPSVEEARVLVEAAIDCGAEDVEEHAAEEYGSARVDVWTRADALASLRAQMMSACGTPAASEQLVYVADAPLELPPEEQGALDAALEALDDVEELWHNTVT